MAFTHRRPLRAFASFSVLFAAASLYAVGCGSEDPEPKPPSTVTEACIPSKNPNPVAVECGVFVSASGNDMATGSKQAPVATLAKAIELVGSNAGKAVYACAGTFKEAVKIPQGVTLFGGLDCATKEFRYGGPDARTTIAPEADQIPLTFSKGAATTYLENIAATAADAVIPSGSSIAAVADEGASVRLVHCDLTAGAGATGATGEIPTDNIGPTNPADPLIIGDAGKAACFGGSSGNPGGAEKQNKLCPESVGGAGGTALATEGGNGAPGSPADDVFGLGGIGSTGNGCMAGGSGKAGSDGGPGVGATPESVGTISATGYAGPVGGSGLVGSAGQGGGGGGASKGTDNCYGASGGSGGAGGCGGKGGKGGHGGGSSFALVSLNARLVFEEVKLTSGAGGTGGEGGLGQNGAIGGDGGPGGAAGMGIVAACGGGTGGPGGRGGKGGGGLGGHSAAIAWKGQSPATTGATITIGAAGAGGLGEGEPGTGAPGQANDLIEFE